MALTAPSYVMLWVASGLFMCHSITQGHGSSQCTRLSNVCCCGHRCRCFLVPCLLPPLDTPVCVTLTLSHVCHTTPTHVCLTNAHAVDACRTACCSLMSPSSLSGGSCARGQAHLLPCAALAKVSRCALVHASEVDMDMQVACPVTGVVLHCTGDG
jgi:hypothetical protein